LVRVGRHLHFRPLRHLGTRFSPALLAFAAHHRYEPRPVAVARGNENGRLERAIRYVRNSLFAARAFTDLADLNAQARLWCEGRASDRRWPQDTSLSVLEAFDAERASLLALTEREYPLGERVAVMVGKTPYARFDLNDYSVPHTHIRRTLSMLAHEQQVRVLDGVQELACHETAPTASSPSTPIATCSGTARHPS
jgi:hypothetical protein